MSLRTERKEAADQALEMFDFEGEVADVSGWDEDGNVWSCTVYVADEEDEENESSIPLSFTVWFEKGTSEIADKDCSCI